MRIGLIGTGYYLPAGRELVSDVAARLRLSPAAVRKSGAVALSVARSDESASEMAIAASRAALQQAGLGAESVGLLIYCGDHKDYVKWQAATCVQQALGAKRAVCFDLYQTCNSMVLGWRLATRAIEARDCDYALVVAAEKYGASVPTRVIGSGIFVGDGAAAAVVGSVDERSSPAPHFRSFAFASNGEYHDMMYVKRGGVRHPRGEAHDLEDDVYRLRRTLSDAELKTFLTLVEETALGLLDEACRAAGVQRSEIDLVVTLNGNDGHNQRFISAAGLERCRNTRAFIVEAGHLGGADAVYNLHRACESGLAAPGDLVAVYSGGAGYSWAVSLLQI